MSIRPIDLLEDNECPSNDCRKQEEETIHHDNKTKQLLRVCKLNMINAAPGTTLGFILIHIVYYGSVMNTLINNEKQTHYADLFLTPL